MSREDTIAIALATDAFRRFGTAFLWNVRRPESLTVGEDAFDYTERVARRLSVVGNREAIDLGNKMLEELSEPLGPEGPSF
jgi:hypothetical protein